MSDDANHKKSWGFELEEYIREGEPDDDTKCKNCTLNCTLEELAILKQLSTHPQMTQKELATAIGRSERTIKTRTVDLQERGLLARENGKRNGNWVVLVELDDGNE